MAFGIADAALSLLSLLLILTAAWAGLRLVRAPRAAAEGAEVLSDGAVVIADGGRIKHLAAGARELLGDVTGQPLHATLAAFLGDGGEEALGALDRLERTGEPVRVLTSDRAGRSLELDGAPQGGQVRVVLRDASLVERRVAAAETELSEREAALDARSNAEATLSTLLEAGSLLLWRRNAEGAPIWSGGLIAAEGGTVTAADLLPLLSDPPAARESAHGGAGRKSRVEVTLGSGDAVALHVVEVLTEGGGAEGFAADATAATSAERTLGRLIHTMTDTFAHLTVGLAIFDRNQTLALFNPALIQMWQVDASWLARRPSFLEILDGLRAARRIPEVADFHEWRRGLLALFDDTDKVDYEEFWQLADGSNVRVFARPHLHGSIAFVFDDVTERMRLERRFRHSIELRRVTLDRLDEGLAVFGGDGMLQFVNGAFHRIWGTEPGTLGRNVHARDLTRICSAGSVEADVWERALGFITADEERQSWSTRVTLGSGQIVGVLLAALPGGSSMMVFSDISDSERMAAALRERNEALEAAEEMRNAVFDQVSERLRKPLNEIVGLARLLTEAEGGGAPEQRDRANGILEAAGDLLDTIDEVAELAMLQVEPLHDEVAPHRVWETLELTAGLLRERAAAAGATLSVAELPDGAGHLVCELPALRRIVFLMTTRALDRAGPGRHIQLGAHAIDDTVLEVSIHETGGETMPPDSPLGDSSVWPVLQGMVAQSGGTYRMISGPGEREVRVICQLSCALVPVEDLEPEMDPEPPELIDDDPGAGA